MQKESADDSDCLDDVVDPRVQVNQYVLRRIIQKLSEAFGSFQKLVTRAILTFPRCSE